VKAFTKHAGLVAPMDRVNVDTDQIVGTPLSEDEIVKGHDRELINNFRMRSRLGRLGGVL